MAQELFYRDLLEVWWDMLLLHTVVKQTCLSSVLTWEVSQLDSVIYLYFNSWKILEFWEAVFQYLKVLKNGDFLTLSRKPKQMV